MLMSMLFFATSHCGVSETLRCPSPPKYTHILDSWWEGEEGTRLFCSGDFRILLLYLSPLSPWTPDSQNVGSSHLPRGRCWSFWKSSTLPMFWTAGNSLEDTRSPNVPFTCHLLLKLEGKSWVGVQSNNFQLGNGKHGLATHLDSVHGYGI